MTGIATETASQTQVRHIANATYTNVSADEEPYAQGSAGVALSRGNVKRQFVGDIVGDSVAVVLIARGSAERLGYLATDHFIGRIGTRQGSFVFQHGGTIVNGALTPFGYVVPGTGTGQLAGLTGSVRITFIPPATHTLVLRYDFEGA
jgi:Protein of unknown function (DUF3224)